MRNLVEGECKEHRSIIIANIIISSKFGVIFEPQDVNKRAKRLLRGLHGLVTSSNIKDDPLKT